MQSISLKFISALIFKNPRQSMDAAISRAGLWIIVAFFYIAAIIPSTAAAKIYVKVDQYSTQKFPIAVTKFANRSTVPDSDDLENHIHLLIQKNLEFTTLFRFISPKAFLEDPTKAGYAASTIDFANWAVIDAQALIKGWFALDANNSLTVEVHLFDVLSKSSILARKYSSGKDKLYEIINRASNDIMEALTGEQGIFGTKIAFVSNRTGNKEIYTMDLDGRNLTAITSNKSINLSPEWSRKGDKIAFTSFKEGAGSRLFIADPATKKTEGFEKLNGTVIGPAFSPASDILAFTLTQKYDRAIFSYNPKTHALNKISHRSTIDVSPSFSPDGSEFVFASNRSGRVHIYRKKVGSSKPAVRLTFQGVRNVDPEWSPKGDKIVFSGMDTDGHYDLFLMNADGSNLARITYDTRSNEHPSFSPDGQFIVFSSNRTGRHQLYVMRPSVMSDTIRITNDAFDSSMPSWSPRFK